MADEKMKLLLVDDDKFLLDMYSTKFTEQGFEVQAVPNAADAIEKLKSGYVPDVCLVDVIMPGMDGFQLLEEMKGKKLCGDTTTCVILSNLGQKEDIDKGLSLGADGYIVKASATPSEVVTRVRDIVAQKK